MVEPDLHPYWTVGLVDGELRLIDHGFCKTKKGVSAIWYHDRIVSYVSQEEAFYDAQFYLIDLPKVI